jgi:hypothetical protein
VVGEKEPIAMLFAAKLGLIAVASTGLRASIGSSLLLDMKIWICQLPWLDSPGEFWAKSPD